MVTATSDLQISKRYSKSIKGVVLSSRLRSKENPQSGYRAHRHYGRNYTSIWGEPSYILSAESVKQYAAQLCDELQLSVDVAYECFQIISQKASPSFYQNGIFDLENFFKLWRQVCIGNQLIYEDRGRQGFSIKTDPAFGEMIDFFVRHTEESILEKITPMLVGYPAEIWRWYELGILCEVNRKIEGPVYDQLLETYCRQELSGKYYLALHQHGNLEADYYLAIARIPRPRQEVRFSSGLMDRFEPVAILGFRLVNPTTWSLENLQGKVKAKFVYSRAGERSNMTSSWGSEMFNELAEFNWCKILVLAFEELARTYSITTLLVRPGEDNAHYNKYRRDTDWGRRYDGTARQMGYAKQLDSNGKRVWVKYLSPVDSQIITLPKHRPGDGFIMH